jgi:hypothetical protein
MSTATAPRKRMFDPRDFGAISSALPDVSFEPPDTARACRIAFQACLDAVQQAGSGVIYVPPGTWPIDRDLIWDGTFNQGAYITWRGEGTGISRIVMRRTLGHNVLRYGLCRVPYGSKQFAVDPGHFVPLDAVLDGSVTGRKGFRTLGKCHLSQTSGHLDQGRGDRYTRTRCLTIEFALDFSKVPAWTGSENYPLFGLLDQHGAGAPIQVNLIRNEARIELGTQGPNGPEDVVRRTFRFGNPWPRALVRGRIVVDLDGPIVRAWTDGKDRPVEQIAGPPLAKSDRFRGSVISPFNVGASSHSAISVGGLFSAPPGSDVGFYGLKVSDGPVYGLDWKRIVDSRPDNDAARYFALDAATVGFLAFDDAPDAIADRVVRVAGWWGTAGGVKGESTAYLLDDVGHRADNSGVHGSRIEGVEFAGGDATHGAALRIGYANGMDVRDCALLGGAHGITTSGAGGSVYPFRGQDLGLRGNHALLAAWYLNWADLERVYSVDGYDFAAFALVNSDMRIDTFRTPEYGKPQFGFYFEGSTGGLRNVALDNEEARGSGSQQAHVYVSPPRGLVYQVSPFTIDGFSAAGIAPDASGVLLGGKADAYIGDAPLAIRNMALHVNFPCRAAVRALPGAEGAWQDAGIFLPSKSGAKVPYEGGPMQKTRPVDTAPVPTPIPPPTPAPVPASGSTAKTGGATP